MSNLDSNKKTLDLIYERSSLVQDRLSFPSINDRFCEGSRAVLPWINGYLNARDDHGGDTKKAKEYLNSIGQNSSEIADRFRGGMLGLAIGDALGTTLEFSQRDSLPQLTRIVGGGPFNLRPGEWTDDTSMAICLAHSLIRKEGFVAQDVMDLFYLWWKKGVFSVNDRCFDIGDTVREALILYENTLEPFAGNSSPQAAGNGSLMRLLPIVLFNFSNIDQCIEACASSSKLTHKAVEAVDACRYFGALIVAAIKGEPKEKLTGSVYEPAPSCWQRRPLVSSIVQLASNVHSRARNQIKSTGYVIDTLEAALWAFHNSETFESGALLAANLGGDSDTVAAVYGQLAGAYYGESGINTDWIRTLSKYHIFYYYADQLLRFGVCDYRPR